MRGIINELRYTVTDTVFTFIQQHQCQLKAHPHNVCKTLVLHYIDVFCIMNTREGYHDVNYKCVGLVDGTYVYVRYLLELISYF